MRKSELREIIREELNNARVGRGDTLNENTTRGRHQVEKGLKQFKESIDIAREMFLYGPEPFEIKSKATDRLDDLDVLVKKAEDILKQIKKYG